MFSRPVNSGWKPVPTSKRQEGRPRIPNRPWLGATIPTYLFGFVVYAFLGRAVSGVAPDVVLSCE